MTASPIGAPPVKAILRRPPNWARTGAATARSSAGQRSPVDGRGREAAPPRLVSPEPHGEGEVEERASRRSERARRSMIAA